MTARLPFLWLAVLTAMRVAAAWVDEGPTGAPFAGPSAAFWLGTDALGRDVFARLLGSTEAFFGPALLTVFIGLLLGGSAGAFCAYFPTHPAVPALRGVRTVIESWPRLVLAIVLLSVAVAASSDPAGFAPRRVLVLAAGVGLGFVPQVAAEWEARVARFVRLQFVEAARAHGLSDARILLRHIVLANGGDLALRHACLLFGNLLLVETSLSYLGDYGVPEPRPSWGNMLASVRSHVVHLRTLMQPSDLSISALASALDRGLQQGALLALFAPACCIALSAASLFMIARSLREPS